MEILNTTDGWSPAIESSGGIRDGAWVAEATGLVEMSSWPPGTRLIVCAILQPRHATASWSRIVVWLAP